MIYPGRPLYTEYAVTCNIRIRHDVQLIVPLGFEIHEYSGLFSTFTLMMNAANMSVDLR